MTQTTTEVPAAQATTPVTQLPPPSEALKKLMISGEGGMILRLVGISATFQQLADKFLVEGLGSGFTLEDRQLAIDESLRRAQQAYQRTETLLDDLSMVGNVILDMHGRAMASFAQQDLRAVAAVQPFILPANRMMLDTLARGTLTFVVGAPVNAANQLISGLPKNAYRAAHLLSAVRGGLEATLSGDAELIVIDNLNSLASVDVPDSGAPEASRLEHVVHQLHRAVQKTQLGSIVCFAASLPESIRELIGTKLTYRLVSWNDEQFGPEAFYDASQAQARYDEMLVNIGKELERAKQTVLDIQKRDQDAKDAARGAIEAGTTEPSLKLPAAPAAPPKLILHP